MATEKKNDGDSARNLCFIIYPDSMPKDAIAMLLDEKVNVAISPLHTIPDEKHEEDAQMKPHYHVIISYSGKHKLDELNDRWQNKYKGTKLQKVADRNKYTRYLAHLDNPEKEQFEQNEIMANYDIRPYVAKEVYIIDIIKEVKRRHIKDFNTLVDTLVDEERFAELEKIASKTTFFTKYFDKFFDGKKNQNAS